jgi:hypothetical protein
MARRERPKSGPVKGGGKTPPSRPAPPPPSEVDQLRAELAAMRAEIAALRAERTAAPAVPVAVPISQPAATGVGTGYEYGAKPPSQPETERWFAAQRESQPPPYSPRLEEPERPTRAPREPGSPPGYSPPAAPSEASGPPLREFAAPRGEVDRLKVLSNRLREKLIDGGDRLPPNTQDQVRLAIGRLEGQLRSIQGDGKLPQWQWSNEALPVDRSVIPLGTWSYGSSSHEETRSFTSGEAFLGYLEHRPALLGVLSARPADGHGVAAPRVHAPESVRERIAASPLVEGAPPDQRDRLVDALTSCWEWAEAEGVDVEMEVDFDSSPE